MRIKTVNFLLSEARKGRLEAGCDEAGRGALAGPVFAAAVILPAGFYHPDLNDSKQVEESVRNVLRRYIEENALAYAVAAVDNRKIDRSNILRASLLAMHTALSKLSPQPEYILVDGNKFFAYKNISHECVVKGDTKYASIAAASILAKTYRDEYMLQLAAEYPEYRWDSNKGYATEDHRNAIIAGGITQYHRKTFIKELYKSDNSTQLSLFQ
jgi:ribonuclease HII